MYESTQDVSVSDDFVIEFSVDSVIKYRGHSSRCVRAVPTLVTDGNVTADAVNIMRYVNENLGSDASPNLVPSDPKEKELMEEYFKLADSIFIEALTYKFSPKVPDARPWLLKKLIMKGNHEKKLKALDELVEKHKDDPYLKSCREIKRDLVARTTKFFSTKTWRRSWPLQGRHLRNLPTSWKMAPQHLDMDGL